MSDSYLTIIIGLLPLAAIMVVLQDDPYHALVIRGILGAIAAMIYAVLGAADVALTEALVGTMLAITLYAIAVRSSLVMRLGVLEEPEAQGSPTLTQLSQDLQTLLNKRHLRLELVPYTNLPSLQRALADREVHAICESRSRLNAHSSTAETGPYHITLRVQRLYDILQNELPETTTRLSYIKVADGTPLSLPIASSQSIDWEESQL